MPKRSCLVSVPCGGGHVDYVIEAENSMDAARKALAVHRGAVMDEDVLTVVVNGRSLLLHGSREHNALQPTFRHRAGAVRKS